MRKELIQDIMVSLNDGVKNNIITGRFQEQPAPCPRPARPALVAFDKLLHLSEPRFPHP